MEKVHRKGRTFLHGEDERGKERKGRPKGKQPSQRERSGRWLFLLLLLGQNWLCANAAAGGLQRTGMMGRMQQQEDQVKESRWMEETPQRWRQPQGADRTEMRKEEKRLKCTFLNGSAWSTKKKYMRRCKGTFDIFFGVEHRLRKDEMEEQLNKDAKEGWRFAADAARITDSRQRRSKAHIRRSFCGSRKQSGSSSWRERRSSYVHPRKRRKHCPGMGECAWRDANVRSILLAHGGMDPQETKPFWRRC